MVRTQLARSRLPIGFKPVAAVEFTAPEARGGCDVTLPVAACSNPKKNSPDASGLRAVAAAAQAPHAGVQPITVASRSLRLSTACGVRPIHIWYIEMTHMVAKLRPCTAPAAMVA